MAFNNEEQAIIKAAQQAGLSVDETKQALVNYRLGVKTTPTTQEGGSGSFLSDLGGDVVETGRDIGGAIGRFGETSKEIVGQETRREISPYTTGTFRKLGAIGSLIGQTAGAAFQGIGKAILPQKQEEQVGQAVGAGVRAIAESEPGQQVRAGYEALSPEAQKNVQAGIGIAEGLATVGFGPILGRVNNTARTFLSEADDILARSRQAATKAEAPRITPQQTGGLLRDIRYQLSDIDPQVETALKRSTFDEVNQYFQQARNAAADPAKNTPLELAGSKAEQAFDAIDEARKKAIQGKKSILADVATERISGNTINDVMSTGIQRMQERFGAKISAKGEITSAQGRTLQLDNADQKLVGEYFDRLNSLGVSPTLQQVDDFVDWAQSQLYKQSKTLSKYEVASEPVVRELQSVTGDLNSRLKDAVSNGYGEVNARISRLIDLQDELSRALGADARKGGGLIKRLFSPTGGNTRRIFEEIRQETGIDLFKDATLAKFAMESVGDVRQRSLLQNLDVATQSAAELDITKPLSLIRFIRERADLDAQELANEIIRRSNASSPRQ